MASVLAQGEKEGDKKLIQRSQARWKRDGCGENRRASLLRASLVTNTSNLIPFSSFRVLYKQADQGLQCKWFIWRGSWGPSWGMLDRITTDKDILDHWVQRKGCFIVNKSLVRFLENIRKRSKCHTH